jgi:hypothetical protein
MVSLPQQKMVEGITFLSLLFKPQNRKIPTKNSRKIALLKKTVVMPPMHQPIPSPLLPRVVFEAGGKAREEEIPARLEQGNNTL